MHLLTLKRQDFVQIFCCLKSCAKYCLDPQPELESEPEPEPKLFQSWNRERNMQIITFPQH
jgi:hypothetical protein